jgi:hypothetical protein
MSFGFDMNEGGIDAQSADAFAKTGGRLPPGRHHARLDGYRMTSAGSGTPFHELTFAVASGPFAGTEVIEKLYESSKPAGIQRLQLFARKLGAMVLKNGKYVPVEGKEGYDDLIGNEVVIEVVHEPWENKDKGTSGTNVKLTFNGIYALTDPEARGIVKGRPAGGGQSAGGAPRVGL